MIKTAEDVISVAKSRGLTVRINPGPPPMPVLFRPFNVPLDEASKPLIEALKAWRLEIIELLDKEKMK